MVFGVWLWLPGRPTHCLPEFLHNFAAPVPTRASPLPGARIILPGQDQAGGQEVHGRGVGLRYSSTPKGPVRLRESPFNHNAGRSPCQQHPIRFSNSLLILMRRFGGTWISRNLFPCWSLAVCFSLAPTAWILTLLVCVLLGAGVFAFAFNALLRLDIK